MRQQTYKETQEETQTFEFGRYAILVVIAMVRIDPRPDIDDLRDEFRKYWFDKLDEARDAILARIQAWELFSRQIFSLKTLISKQTNAEWETAIDELLMLFGYQISEEELLETYGSYLEASYLRGTDTSDDFPYYEHAFGQPDYDSLRFLHSQGPAIFKNYFGAVGSSLRNAMMQSMGLGEVRQKLARRIRDTFRMSKYRADTIVRTELARAAIEGRLNAYEQNPEADLVEWFYAKTGKRCSRIPQCAQMDGEVFKVEEAHGLIPAHPRCECTFRPLTKTQQARDIFKKHMQNWGAANEDGDTLMYEFLSFPTSLRDLMLKDLESGQLKIILISEHANRAEMAGGVSGWGGFYYNKGTHAHINAADMAKLKDNQDMIVVGGGGGTSELRRIFNHEVSHYIDMSLYARTVRGIRPDQLSAPFRASRSLEWNRYYNNFKDLPRHKQWIDPINAGKDVGELFAESFHELFMRPYHMRPIIQKYHPGLWESVLVVLRRLEEAGG